MILTNTDLMYQSGKVDVTMYILETSPSDLQLRRWCEGQFPHSRNAGRDWLLGSPHLEIFILTFIQYQKKCEYVNVSQAPGPPKQTLPLVWFLVARYSVYRNRYMYVYVTCLVYNLYAAPIQQTSSHG